MATYTGQNVVDLAKKFIRDAVITSIDSQTVDTVGSIIWTYYPWRWAQAALTAITVVDGTQDHTISNNDVFKLLRVRITRTDVTPDTYQELGVRNWLPPDLTKRGLTAIPACCFEPVGGKLRLEAAASVASGETYTINGEYWKNPTLINDAGLSTALPSPDQFFPVWVAGVKWQFYDYLGNPKAGTVATDKRGNITYTGQLGVFMGLLAQMASAEDVDGDSTQFPDSPLGAASYGSMSLYGV